MAIDRRELRARTERARARSRWIDLALAVRERDASIGGGMLAAAVAYRLFLFVLPLGFFLVAALGILSDALGTEPQDLSADAGIARFVTEEVSSTASSSSSWWVALAALAALPYVTLTLFKALAGAYALAWERSAASVRVSPGAVALFAAALLLQLALVAGGAAVRHHTDEEAGNIAALAVFLVGIAAIWLAVCVVLPHSGAAWRDLVPGAVLYALGMLGVQVFAVYIFDRVLESKTSTYGALGTAAAILLGAYLLGRVAVAAASLNATLYERRAAS